MKWNLKFIVIFALFTNFSFAKSISYKEPLPLVRNGSWKYECIVRIDFKKRLLNLTDCSILDSASDITLYDKEDNFIGRYYSSNYEEIKGNYQYINMKLHLANDGVFNTVEIKDIHHIRLEKPKWNLDEGDVHCNDKTAKTYLLQDSTYGCLVSYKCPKGKYAISEFQCEILPKNATRLDSIGFECLDGFIESTTNDEISCEKIPQNSHTINEYSWECNDNYEEVDGRCVKKISRCKADYIISADELSCEKIPLNSHKVNEYSWECNDNYITSATELSCEKIPLNSHKIDEHSWECNDKFLLDEEFQNCKPLISCNGEDQYQKTPIECGVLPEYAIKLAEGGFECLEGFIWLDDKCEPKKQCTENELYIFEDNSCKAPPEGAIWSPNATTLFDFSCDEKHIKSVYHLQCSKIPPNSHKINDFNWDCNNGYKQIANKCIKKILTCKPDYVISTNELSCEKMPDNAYKISEHSWDCIKGFRKKYGKCVIDDCDKKHFLDIKQNACLDIPKHAHKTGKYTYSCNAGYHADIYGECERDPIILGIDLLFRVPIEIGLGANPFNLKYFDAANSNSTFSANPGFVLFFGLGISMEIKINENLTIGISDQFKIDRHSYGIENFNYAESILSNDISALLAIGSEDFKIFVTPKLSLNLFDFIEENDTDTKSSLNRTSFSIDLGGRLYQKYDFFIGYEKAKLKGLNFIQKDKGTYYLGYRYNATLSTFDL